MKSETQEWQAFLKQQKNEIERRSWITVPLEDPNAKMVKLIHLAMLKP